MEMIIYGGFVYNFQIYLNNMGWIRIRMDPELWPGSRFRKIQTWIRNKSFRIHNTDGYSNLYPNLDWDIEKVRNHWVPVPVYYLATFGNLIR